MRLPAPPCCITIPRPPLLLDGASITMPPGAGAPFDIITWPDTRTSRVAMRPKFTLVFSCAIATVTRWASPRFVVPGSTRPHNRRARPSDR